MSEIQPVERGSLGFASSFDNRIIEFDSDEESYDEDDFIWSSDKSIEDDRTYSLVPVDASRMIYCFDRLDYQGILDVVVRDVPEQIMKKLKTVGQGGELLGKGVQGEAYLVKKNLNQGSKTETKYVIKSISLSKQEWHRAQSKPPECLMVKHRDGVRTTLAVDFWLREMIISSMAHNVFITNKTPHTLKYHWFATGRFPSMSNSNQDTVKQALLAMEPARGTSIELLNWSKADRTVTEWVSIIQYDVFHRFSVFAFQVLQGISAMQYKYRVMHRDLHMANVFIQKTDDGLMGEVRNNGKQEWMTYHIEVPIKSGSQLTWKKMVYSLPNEGYIAKIADWGLAVSHSRHAMVSTKTKPGAYDPMYDVLKIMSSWWRTKKYLARVFLMSDIEDVLYDLVQSFLTVINYDVNRNLFAAATTDERTKVLSYFFDGIPDNVVNNIETKHVNLPTTTTPLLKPEHAMLVKVQNVDWETPKNNNGERQPEKRSKPKSSDDYVSQIFKRRHYFYQPSKREYQGKTRVLYFPRTHALQSAGNTAANIIANTQCFANWTVPRMGAIVATLTKFDYVE